MVSHIFLQSYQQITNLENREKRRKMKLKNKKNVEKTKLEKKNEIDKENMCFTFNCCKVRIDIPNIKIRV